MTTDMTHLLEDYSREEVPDEAKVSGWRICLIMVGVAITVPCFMVGAQLGMSLGSCISVMRPKHQAS